MTPGSRARLRWLISDTTIKQARMRPEYLQLPQANDARLCKIMQNASCGIWITVIKIMIIASHFAHFALQGVRPRSELSVHGQLLEAHKPHVEVRRIQDPAAETPWSNFWARRTPVCLTPVTEETIKQYRLICPDKCIISGVPMFFCWTQCSAQSHLWNDLLCLLVQSASSSWWWQGLEGSHLWLLAQEPDSGGSFLTQ